MPDLGLTRQGLVDYTTSTMGSPAIQLHVTSKQFNNEMDYILNVYSRRKPRVKFGVIGTTPGVQNYTPPTDPGYGVVSVMPPRFDPIAPLLLSAGPRLDIFGYRYSYPYRDIAELELDYAYFDMATRTLSSEIDWEFIDGQIWIYPAPIETFQFSYGFLVPKILGDDNSLTATTIPMGDWDWIKDAFTARVKMLEGRILRRFNGIPGATAPLQTDGASLVKEGDAEWSACLEDLQLRTKEIPFRKSGQSAAFLPSAN
jgi:hypothetical protein